MGTASFTPLNYSKYIINHKRIKNISFSGTNNINSDYIFTNYVYEGNPKYKKKYFIPKNYEKFYTLKKGNIVINEIYKKKYQINLQSPMFNSISSSLIWFKVVHLFFFRIL